MDKKFFLFTHLCHLKGIRKTSSFGSLKSSASYIFPLSLSLWVREGDYLGKPFIPLSPQFSVCEAAAAPAGAKKEGRM